MKNKSCKNALSVWCQVDTDIRFLFLLSTFYVDGRDLIKTKSNYVLYFTIISLSNLYKKTNCQKPFDFFTENFLDFCKICDSQTKLLNTYNYNKILFISIIYNFVAGTNFA